MHFPYPDEISPSLRKTLRRLVPDHVRRGAVRMMWRTAELTDALDPGYVRNQRGLGELRDRHSGSVCVVVGNGPSLRNTDLQLVSRHVSFGLNRINLLADETGFVPSYHVVVNDVLLEQFSAELLEVPSTLFVPWRRRAQFSSRSNMYFFASRTDDRFSTDARKGVGVGGTVTMVALQLAFHMGFSRVLLVGVDHRYRFEGAPNEELVATGADPNHFSDRYFAGGTRWNAPDLARSEISYRQARSVFEAHGRKIVDCTVGGALTVFEKSTLERELRQDGLGG